MQIQMKNNLRNNQLFNYAVFQIFVFPHLIVQRTINRRELLSKLGEQAVEYHTEFLLRLPDFYLRR